jgi:hypothetical protein
MLHEAHVVQRVELPQGRGVGAVAAPLAEASRCAWRPKNYKTDKFIKKLHVISFFRKLKIIL